VVVVAVIGGGVIVGGVGPVPAVVPDMF
jgi:hypothetical protein